MVKGIPNNKAPRSDGLPALIYKQYIPLLLPELLKTLNCPLEIGGLSDSMSEAIIVVLPKSGKDPSLVDSYRPVSLLFTDVKILAKILANGLAPLMSTLIHKDQSWFHPFPIRSYLHSETVSEHTNSIGQ